MGQKINPIALRLGGRINWLTLNPNNKAKNSNLHESIFINYLVSGVFKSFNIFVSELVIKKETISSESLPGPGLSTGQGPLAPARGLPKDKPGRLVNHNKRSRSVLDLTSGPLFRRHANRRGALCGSGGQSLVRSNEYLLWNYRRKDFIEINKIIKNESVTDNTINREAEMPGAWSKSCIQDKSNNKDIIKISGLIYLGSSPKSFLGQGLRRIINQKTRPGHGARSAHNALSRRQDGAGPAQGPAQGRGNGNNRFNKVVQAIKNKSGKNQSRRTKLLLEEINKLIIKLLKIVLLGGNYKSQTDIILDFEQIRSPLSNSNILSNWIELSLLENSRIMNDRKIFKWLFSDSLGKPRESRFTRGKQGRSTIRGK